MFQITNKKLKDTSLLGIPKDTNILDHKQRTTILKEEKLKAKALLEKTTFEWRTESLRLRELNAREALNKLAEKQAKQLRLRQIEEEVSKKIAHKEIEDEKV